MTHICVGELTIIVSDNGLSPGWRQSIIWSNAEILLIGSYQTNFSEILIAFLTFLFTKMSFKVSSAKWRAFCLGLNVLNGSLLSYIMTEAFSFIERQIENLNTIYSNTEQFSSNITSTHLTWLFDETNAATKYCYAHRRHDLHCNGFFVKKMNTHMSELLGKETNAMKLTVFASPVWEINAPLPADSHHSVYWLDN